MRPRARAPRRRYYAYIDAAQGRFCTHSVANGTDVFCSPATANASSAIFYARLDDGGAFCLRRGTPAADQGAVWCPAPWSAEAVAAAAVAAAATTAATSASAGNNSTGGGGSDGGSSSSSSSSRIGTGGARNLASCTLASWQATGHDVHSLVGQNPLFVDPGARDFRLQPASPAHALGIQSIDPSTVGPQY
jgi:hypothetical protein